MFRTTLIATLIMIACVGSVQAWETSSFCSGSDGYDYDPYSANNPYTTGTIQWYVYVNAYGHTGYAWAEASAYSISVDCDAGLIATSDTDTAYTSAASIATVNLVTECESEDATQAWARATARATWIDN